MKRKYITPEIEISRFMSDDIITTSSVGDSASTDNTPEDTTMYLQEADYQNKVSFDDLF